MINRPKTVRVWFMAVLLFLKTKKKEKSSPGCSLSQFFPAAPSSKKIVFMVIL